MRTLLSALRGRRLRTALVALTLVLLGVMAGAARCIENTSVRKDADGFTHITGEMYNDTDIQGAAIRLHGRLLDAQGGVIAEQDAPICPPDSQPHAQSAFDIVFDNPGLPQYASQDVRAIGGATAAQPLPDPKITVTQKLAVRLKSPPDEVGVMLTGRNGSTKAYAALQGCAAAYDNLGKVVAVTSDELITKSGNNIVPVKLAPSASSDMFLFMEKVPSSAVHVRAWIWVGNTGDSTSQFAFVMTDKIPIRAQ